MVVEGEGRTNGMREPRRAKGIERTRQHNKDTEPIIIILPPSFQSSKRPTERTSLVSSWGDDSIATQLTSIVRTKIRTQNISPVGASIDGRRTNRPFPSDERESERSNRWDKKRVIEDARRLSANWERRKEKEEGRKKRDTGRRKPRTESNGKRNERKREGRRRIGEREGGRRSEGGGDRWVKDRERAVQSSSGEVCESSAREGNAERHGAAWCEDRGARGGCSNGLWRERGSRCKLVGSVSVSVHADGESVGGVGARVASNRIPNETVLCCWTRVVWARVSNRSRSPFDSARLDDAR